MINYIILTLFFKSYSKVDCAKITSLAEADDFLKSNNKDHRNFDYILPTNLAKIYLLENGKIVMIPNLFQDDMQCLIFENESCFNKALKQDSFPIENYDKSIYESDIEGLKKINDNISKYQAYLNNELGFDYTILTREIADTYYTKVLSKAKKKDMDFIALGAVMGEVLRAGLGGRWILVKRYGPYNPYYVPEILFDGDKMIDIYGTLDGILDGKIKDTKIFYSTAFTHSKKKLMDSGLTLIELQ